jgi:predicted N-acetyltransferase YhbS
MSQYRFKQSFSEDCTLRDRLFDLLETTFPGIRKAAQSIRELGAPWEEASTPFIHFEDNIAVTHVGVLEIPMQLMGKPIIVGGIHAVCTHPNFRRRGYYRQVMKEVLDYCANRYETLILTTAQPKIYTAFGFRVVEEHLFIRKCNSTNYKHGFRRLNLADTQDLSLLHKLLETRQPISNIVGVWHEKPIFCFYEGTQPLHYAEDLDLIVSMEIDNTQLKLFDVVGTKICSLADLVERIPQPIEEVAIYFSPDRLDTEVQSFPHVLDGDSWLMVRGSFAAEGQQFMLPRSTRC